MHRRPSLHRCAVALLLLVSVLFSQWALASYVCPGMTGLQALAQGTADGAPCDGMDTLQPVLCHQHGTDASQAFEHWKAATPTLPAIVQILHLPLVLLSDRAGLNLQRVPEPRPPPEPVFLSTRRLRV